MCGRYTLTNPEAALAEVLGEAPAGIAARYNIAPSEEVAVVRRRDGERELAWLRWGLVPATTAGAEVGNRLINARAETVASKPSFRASFARCRCLIPADGFYEWRRYAGHRQPYFFHLEDRRPFAFAGLWTSWGHGRERIESCSIITTAANAIVAPVHDRMPVILLPASYARWLGEGDDEPATLLTLLRPYPAAGMALYPVAAAVNRAGFEDPTLIEPIAPPPENLRLF